MSTTVELLTYLLENLIFFPDFHFSQQCCWRFRSSRMRRCASVSVRPNVCCTLKEYVCFHLLPSFPITSWPRPSKYCTVKVLKVLRDNVCKWHPCFQAFYNLLHFLERMLFSFILNKDHIRPSFIKSKQLRPVITQNSVQETKCNGVFQIIKIRHFWHCIRSFWLPHGARKHLQQ
jgi:hypothetical protein